MDDKNNKDNINNSVRGRGESPSASDKGRGGTPSQAENNKENNPRYGKTTPDEGIAENYMSETEINFRNVLRKPLRWFGFIYFYFLALLIAGGIFYVNNIEQIHRNSIPAVLSDSSNIFRDIKPVKGSISQAVDIAALMNPTDEMKTRGEQLFKTNCTACHGNNGEGDGPAGTVLNPKPRNFHTDQNWVNGREFLGMFKTLQQGVPTTGMPAYDHLPVQDRIDIITYVRTMADFPPVTDNDLTQLNNLYNLAKGDTTSSQISIEAAVKKISEEALPSVQSVYARVSVMNSNATEYGYTLLDRVAADKVKIISFLSSSQDWKNNLNAFIKTVISSSGVNGFRSNIASLSGEEWDELHRYLVKVFS